METINAKDLRIHLKERLEEIEKGQSYTIIYRSKPVAKIVPLNSDSTISNSQIVSDKVRKYLATSRKTRYSNLKDFNYKKEYGKRLDEKNGHESSN